MPERLTLLESIGRMEGFNFAGSRPARNNNPGDIEWGRFSRSHGAIGAEGRFAIFASPAAGYKAMASLLSSAAYQGLTIQQALKKWAPPPENDVARYLRNVLAWTGLKAEDPIVNHLDIPVAST